VRSVLKLYKNHLNYSAIAVFVLIFAGVGAKLLISSHAASPYASLEADSGQLTGSATIQSDPNASSGSYVQFGTNPTNLTAMIQGIESPTKAVASEYSTNDNLGNSMDSLKIIANPSGGYLGVYQDINGTTGVGTVKLATSTDLMHWTFVTNLDDQASQPNIVATSDGGFLVVEEYNNQTGSGGEVRFLHYPSLSALYSGTYDKEFTAARTLSNSNEGTPNIYSVTLSPNISNSVINIGFHYNDNTTGHDRQATGTLTNFSTWTASIDTTLNNAIIAAAAAAGQTVNGNIGDRDDVIYQGSIYNLQEVQYTSGDFGSWRTYFYNFSNNTAQPLNITTAHGSTAFANPHFTILKAPNGTPSMVVTLFIPVQGAGLDEAGTAIYYFPLN
jgi:hypothetical protein